MEDRQESSEASEWEVSAPLRFSDGDDLRAALAGYSESGGVRSRVADDGFVSYLETVMEEPGYDDQPYAILSGAFGAILNSEGEVVFGDNLIHVSRHGILYGPVSESETIRNLAGMFDLLSLCAEQGYYAPADRDDFYKVNGYEGIYLYDTFGFINEGKNTGDTRSLLTPSPDYHYDIYDIDASSISIGFRREGSTPGLYIYNWDSRFLFPEGDQKSYFPDRKHCNDTKIYHQDLGIWSDTGLKTKTMKKRALGYWDKIKGDMEGGIARLSVYEKLPSGPESTFVHSNGINKVNFGGKTYTVYTMFGYDYSITDLLKSHEKDGAIGVINRMENETGVRVDAIRYILNSKEAVTLFPFNIEKGNMSKIEKSFVVPFGGKSSGVGYSNGTFHVLYQDIFGFTIRDKEVRGTLLRYHY